MVDSYRKWHLTVKNEEKRRVNEIVFTVHPLTRITKECQLFSFEFFIDLVETLFLKTKLEKNYFNIEIKKFSVLVALRFFSRVCKKHCRSQVAMHLLGPLLFILYINDLPDNLTHKLKLYADDQKLIEINIKIYILSFFEVHEKRTENRIVAHFFK